MEDDKPELAPPDNTPAKPEVEINEVTSNVLPPGVTNEFCLNCGTKLTDIYCHHCGQKDIPRRQTIWDTFMNFISSNWSFEGKFLKTTRYLLTKPGFLAAEYNAGRRERYFHPARMYVFISFVFFLLFFSLPDTKESGVVDMDLDDFNEVRKDLKAAGLDTIMNLQNVPDSVLQRMMPVITDSLARSGVFKTGNNDVNFRFSGVEYSSVARYDSAQRAKAPDERDGWFASSMMRRMIFINTKYKGKTQEFTADMSQAFADNFSKILFWLLPFFALLLKLLYTRRDYYYSEHLVFSVYYYDFVFLAGCMYLLAAQINDTWLTTIIGLWMYLYLLFAMKRVYAQGWGKTILKLGIFTGLFFVLFVIAFAITAFAILLTM